MASEYKVQRVKNQFGAEHVMIRVVQEIIFEAQPLYIPASAPDMRAVRYAVRRLGALRRKLFFKGGQRAANGGRQVRVADCLVGASDEPAHARDFGGY